MAELKVGLAANRTSYFDQITNTYITLQAPVQSVTYDENDMPATVKRLEKIVHALFASVPALVLYEGKVPQECIDAWKAKYMKPFNTLTTRNIVVDGKVIGTLPIADPIRNGTGDTTGRVIEPNRAFDRPDKVNEASADNDAVGVSTGEGEQVTLFSQADEQEPAQGEVQEPEDQESQEEAEEKKPATRKKATTTKTDK